MKYNKHTSLKNLISILLVCLLVLGMSSCDSTSEEEISFIEEVLPQTDEFTLETAKTLVKRDRLVTDMFVNNSLCFGKTADYVAVDSANSYSSFKKLGTLLGNTYSEAGGTAKKLFAYPNEELPSVKGIEGMTYVFNHAGSYFDGYAVESSLAVKDTENPDKKLISAQTEDGNEIEFTAVRENGKWVLQQGIYALNPQAEVQFTKKFKNALLGSFSEFSGDILVIELFVLDKQTDFTAEKEELYHKKLENAFGYILEQAEGCGIEANITYERIYYEHSGILGTRPLDFDIVFAETGFGTLERFAEENYDLSAYDNYVFAVCLDKEVQTSHALYKGTKETEAYIGERVIFGSNAREEDISVSLLSLIGAYGYDEGVCDEYTETLYRKYFPNDIMVSKSYENSEMSPVTAYACGFTDDLSPLYQVFYYD